MEDVSIASGRPPEVDRVEGSTTVMLTIRGTRGEKVRDRDTRVRIALSGGRAVRLWRLLGERLTDAEKEKTEVGSCSANRGTGTARAL
jgi:hypothetical protein